MRSTLTALDCFRALRDGNVLGFDAALTLLVSIRDSECEMVDTLQKRYAALMVGLEVFDLNEIDLCLEWLAKFEVNGTNYAVLTDDEVDIMVAESVKESLCDLGVTCLADLTGVDEDTLAPIVTRGDNKALLAIVRGTCQISSVVEEVKCYYGEGRYIGAKENTYPIQSGNFRIFTLER